ncbi:sensor histidine kinase [Nonomuraea sp. NN258]|uniref:sensor histidine kinase n=1 Tax=Nonomuraea antri TaxID=2730852 RepID=UPI00156A0190|nr:sensor histidine kinase [Nonomuraea antri]NRQ33474.1 sensor histidine kinase [Nonomuraea antri]
MISAIVRPLRLALLLDDTAPPRAGRPRLTFAVPAPLRRLVPFRTVELVQLADLVLAVILFLLMMGYVGVWAANAAKERALGLPAPGPVSDGYVYLAAIAVSLPVALRDRLPLVAWRLSVLLMPVALWVSATIGRGDPPFVPPVVVSYLFVLYSLAVRSDRRIAVVAWVVTVIMGWITHPGSAPMVAVIAAGVLLFGHNLQVRRSATARLIAEERRTRQAEGAQAALAERARIARELHDVVAHHMSVIAIQAEAVPLRAAGDPVQLTAGLAEIRTLSLAAIAELRQVLGVLRDDDGRTDTAPQPGLDRLDDLVDQARAAGLKVLLERPSSLGEVPQAVGLSAYRIVQESLSNAMRHAPGASVAVGVARDDDGVRLRVANGPGARPGDSPGAGHGLVGMRERAALLGGTLDAGPVAGGGFQVTATLPIGRGDDA